MSAAVEPKTHQHLHFNWLEVMILRWFGGIAAWLLLLLLLLLFKLRSCVADTSDVVGLAVISLVRCDCACSWAAFVRPVVWPTAAAALFAAAEAAAAAADVAIDGRLMPSWCCRLLICSISVSYMWEINENERNSQQNVCASFKFTPRPLIIMQQHRTWNRWTGTSLLLLSDNESAAVKGDAFDPKSLVVNGWCGCWLVMDDVNAESVAPNTNGNGSFCCSDFALPTIFMCVTSSNGRYPQTEAGVMLRDRFVNITLSPQLSWLLLDLSCSQSETALVVLFECIVSIAPKNRFLSLRRIVLQMVLFVTAVCFCFFLFCCCCCFIWVHDEQYVGVCL